MRLQLFGGRFCRVKLVTAPGAMNTEWPNTTAEMSSADPLGNTTGRADPVAISVEISVNGKPDL